MQLLAFPRLFLWVHSGSFLGHKNPWSNGRLKTTAFGRWQRRDVGALSRTASRLTGHHCSENSLQSKLGPVAFGWPGFVFSCVWVGPNGKHEPGLGWDLHKIKSVQIRRSSDPHPPTAWKGGRTPNKVPCFIPHPLGEKGRSCT